jgi:Kdo2-lipid IVA lauroyltransferase/acyltransferase
MEMPLGWFAPMDRLRKLVRVEGKDHLDAAIERGKGVILFMAHFTPMEICASRLYDLCPGLSFLYHPQRNAFVDTLIKRGRSRYAGEQIPRGNIRALLRVLRSNGVVAYVPDQTYVGNQSAVLPFFGEPAVTNIVTGKLAKISGATVLPFFFRRLPDDSGYVINIGAPLENFPTKDPIEDTRRLITLLEGYIRLAPEQYLWTYKKFKRRPAPYPDLYRMTRSEA